MSASHCELVTSTVADQLRQAVRRQVAGDRCHQGEAVAVLYYLLRWARKNVRHRGRVLPLAVTETVPQIAAGVSISERTVQRCLAVLDAAGLSRTVRRGRRGPAGGGVGSLRELLPGAAQLSTAPAPVSAPEPILTPDRTDTHAGCRRIPPTTDVVPPFAPAAAGEVIGAPGRLPGTVWLTKDQIGEIRGELDRGRARGERARRWQIA